MTDDHSMHLPARDLPIPTTLSEIARAVMAIGNPLVAKPWPPLSDRAAVAAHIADMLAQMPPGGEGPMVASLYGAADTGVAGKTERIELGEFGVWQAVPDGVEDGDPRVFLALHGAFIHGRDELSRLGAIMVAGGVGARTWAVDYRMPPYHPFPYALDDCVNAYRALLESHRPEDIIIGGMSAGGNLTAATILRARDEGLPLPAAAVMHTPATDLTRQGDSYQTNGPLDVSYSGGELDNVIELYIGDHEDRTDPYLSPIFGEFEKGFPPSLLTTGTRDFLLSDTVRMHRKLLSAGVNAQLHVWEGAPHYMFLGMAPEDRERVEQTRAFVEGVWGRNAGFRS